MSSHFTIPPIYYDVIHNKYDIIKNTYDIINIDDIIMFIFLLNCQFMYILHKKITVMYWPFCLQQGSNCIYYIVAV